MNTRRYDRTGILAVDPQAFTMLFADSPSRDTVDMGGVPVLTVRGPLEHHAGFWCDSYDAILSRASEALSSGAPGLVLRIDSPGGLVSGCMETARAIRALADGSGKRLVAYVDGSACSAAYALACVAHSIVAPPSSTLGSIGVLRARIDASAAIAAGGIAMHLIKSGARKGDGDPALPMGADELAAIQDSVDTLASMFFGHVAQHRGVALDVVQGLQAGVLHGERAVALGLADLVGSLDDALAMARGTYQPAAAPQGDTAMATMDEAVEALRAAAEGDDEKEAARAKRMLAAMEEDECDGASGDDNAPADPPADPPPPPAKKDDEEDAKAIAARALALSEQTARAQILGTRPDLTKEAIANLARVPTDALADALKAIPRTSVKPPKVATPTLGQGQGGTQVSLGARTFAPNEELDRAMGITTSTEPPIKRGATYTEFGTLSRAQADEILNKNGGAR